MTDEKIVNKLIDIGYEPFQYDADPDELNDNNVPEYPDSDVV